MLVSTAKNESKNESIPENPLDAQPDEGASSSKSEQIIETRESNRDWKITDFDVERRTLGHGQYGIVYLVHEKTTKSTYAIKKQQRDITIEIMLAREIGIQQDLYHRNILQLYGYFYEDKHVYMVLEYAPYGNLRTKLDKQPEKRFDEKCAAHYILSCTDALSYLHERNIIHRDIKPSNLLISYNDELKIADFGISINAQNKRRRTICGTPDYISPEIMNGESYSKEIDLWSLGVLSYDLLVGEWAFKAATEQDRYWKTIKANYNPFPEFLSKTAGDLIQRLLVVDPELRSTLSDVKKHPWIVANT